MRSAEPFEQSVQRALEHYEVPYNSADWAKLEKALDQERGPAWYSSVGLYALLLGGSLAVASTLYLLSSEASNKASNGAIALLTGDDGIALLQDDPTKEPIGSVEGQQHGALAVEGDLSPSIVSEQAKPGPAVKGSKAGAIAPPSVPGAANPSGELTPPKSEVTERLIRISMTEGCPGTVIDFGLESASENGIFLWNFGDGSFSNKARPSHAFSKSGSYTVMLSHSAVGGGNFLNRPVSDRIIIHEAPEAVFSPAIREYPNTIPSVHFENHSVGGKSYFWELGDGSTSTEVHVDHVYKKKGEYPVVLNVTNANGCVDRTERIITIDRDYDLLAPKTFSPNSDGVEDTFIPEALKTVRANFNMTIFDQATGQLIYETNDPSRPWNGRVGNKGEICRVGDYVWMVEMKEGEKHGGSYNGLIRLMR